MKGTGMTITQLLQHQINNGMVAKGDEGKQLMSLIRENNRLLEQCSKHDFSIDLSNKAGMSFQSKFECTHCGGEVDYSHKKWYELGLSHGSSL